MPLSYTRKNSKQTLDQALDEFYQANPHFDKRQDKSELAVFMRSHDVIHVVFGLTTEITDEMLADFSAMFCTDIGTLAYISNLKPLMQDKELMDSLEKDPMLAKKGGLTTIWALLSALPKVVTLYLRSRKMTKKWLWSGYDSYHHQSLMNIRNQFNIQIETR